MFSNGIVLLALAAGVLIVVFDANTTRLIQLYIIGVFVSFTLSQAGMVRHWAAELAEAAAGRAPPDAPLAADQRGRRGAHRRRAGHRARSPSSLHGAWIVVIAMPVLFA